MLYNYLSRAATTVATNRCWMSTNAAPITNIQNHHQLNSLLTQHPQTPIIDVRAPSEFLHDHIPGAINLPVLTEEQRIEVGTVYKGQPFHARRKGAIHISRNISDMLENYFHNKDPASFHPLIYCWRGGQRSKSLTHILSQIGFQVRFLDDGYKTYRKQIVSNLQTIPSTMSFILLGGHTGAGKTKVLQHLYNDGHQMIDLEHLAEHRGSLLGHTDGIKKIQQPSQKTFESRIVKELSKINPNQMVWLEAESNKIGDLHVPTELWSVMKKSPRINLRVPIQERVKHTMQTYQYWMNSNHKKELDMQVLKRLEKKLGKQWYQNMMELVENKQWEEFVERLLTDHYDVLYLANEEKSADVLGEIELDTLNEEDIVDTFLPKVLQYKNVSRI